ncbi:TPA: hypothetical protein HA278_05890 [Candidatus Woesearchaeota archaeon]|nr:hypothetical protein [archaeon]MAG72930.1 hypothetical protein [archaeon]HIJ11562.1 hypothetical protein [Candidatus Woesearchaeota archaeon]
MIDVVEFIMQFKFIIVFYLVIIAILYVVRKKLDIQAKIIVLYRMKWGLKWMDKYSAKFRQWVILLGYIGTGIGFIGMVVISFMLIKNVIDLIITPNATAGVALVLPGVNIPGLGVLPFWDWLVAIFFVAIVHEFAHGVVARAHNIKVKNTGIVFFGPIIGAFVEPDEKTMRKQSDIVQYSVLAAGAFTNIILAVIAVALLTFVTSPLQDTMLEPTGFSFAEYVEGEYPAKAAGLPVATTVTGINGVDVTSFDEFASELRSSRPGDDIIVTAAERQYTLTLAENPDQTGASFLGITQIKNDADMKDAYTSGIGKVGYTILEVLNGKGKGGKGFLFWLYLLSFGIGLFNLLPLPIVDGGRMAQVFLHRLKGEKKGEKAYHYIGGFFLLILVLSLAVPFLLSLV